MNDHVSIMEVGGKDELVISAIGVLRLCYHSWFTEKKPKGKEFLEKYCGILATRRYGKGATEIFADLEAMSSADGLKWLEATYKKYMKPYDVTGLLSSLTGR